MANLKGNDLIAVGFTEESGVIGIALRIVRAHYHPNEKRGVVMQDLLRVLKNPAHYVGHEVFGDLADALIPKVDLSKKELNSDAVPVRIYGEEMIEEGALSQMRIASRLPVSVRGAIMPDGHQGYGLPIGGVLATENAIIPYGVGIDIGCMIKLSLYEAPVNYIDRHVDNLKRVLLDNTRFGVEVHDSPSDSHVFDRSEFDEIPFLKNWKDKARKQLGTSGKGNHFTSIGLVNLQVDGSSINIPKGQYLAIMTHSGSRGMGANVAGHYTKLAMEKCVLPPEAKNLAWLDMNTEEGQEYWLAMNLCADYASACHHDIHKRLAKALSMNAVAHLENRHNLAWKEVHDGRELIVHRKGATPAGKGVLGIIPGSMATPAFIVEGKGDTASLNSASHGAGRLMSRTAAKNSFNMKMLKDFLEEKSVSLIGADVDESPFAYKDIHSVMAKQTDLVGVLGIFTPRIVRMAED